MSENDCRIFYYPGMTSKVIEVAPDFTQGPRELQLCTAASVGSGEKNEAAFLLVHQDGDPTGCL